MSNDDLLLDSVFFSLIKVLHPGEDSNESFSDKPCPCHGKLIRRDNIVRELCVGSGLHREGVSVRVAYEQALRDHPILKMLNCGVCFRPFYCYSAPSCFYCLVKFGPKVAVVAVEAGVRGSFGSFGRTKNFVANL